MSYFIHDGARRLGPFTVEELKGKGILKTTPVWTEGLSDWVQASTLAELQSVILQTPPAFQPEHFSTARATTASTFERIGFNLGRFLRRSVSICLLILVLIVLYLRWTRPTFHPLPVPIISYTDPERVNPSQYLATNGTYHPNFWQTKEEISGTVINRATHTNYKDVHIKVMFYSRTNSVIATQEFVLYQYFLYGSTNSFTLTVDKPAAAATIGWTAVSATYY